MSEETSWSEENSRFFIEYARYVVPEREAQIQTICRLIPDPGQPFDVLELACGAGVLANAILERFPACTLHGLDGSEEMLNAARQRLALFGARFQPGKFELSADDWRAPGPVFQAVVSSLAIHHLDGRGKARLFRDLYSLIKPGGALLIADVVQPAGQQATAYAADTFDEILRRQSLALDGNLNAYHHFQDWNLFRYPDDAMDHPSPILDQLKWLEAAGFQQVDVFWMQAGHAIYGGYKSLF